MNDSRLPQSKFSTVISNGIGGITGFFYSLQNLDRDNYGSWPTHIKFIIVVSLFFTIMLLSYIFLLSGQLQQINALKNQQQVLQTSFHEMTTKIASQDQLHVQKVPLQQQIQQHRKDLLKVLPIYEGNQQTELIKKINRVAIESDVSVKDIATANAVVQEGVVQQPIRLVVTGGYHEFGLLLSGLANLPNLISIEDFEVIRNTSRQNKSRPLMLTLHSKLYFLQQKQSGQDSIANKKSLQED